MVQGNESIVIASMWESMAAWFTPTVLFGLMNLIIATIFIASKSNTKTKTTTKIPNHDHDNEQDHGYSFGRILRVSSFLDRAKSIKLSSLIPAIATTIILQPKTVKYDSLSRLAQSIFTVCSYDSQPDSKRYPSSKPKPNPTPSLLGRLTSIDFSSVYSETDSPGQLVRVPSVVDRANSFKTPSRSIVPENVVSDPGHPVIRSKPKKSRSKPNSKVEIKKTRSEVRTVSSDDEAAVVLRRPETARARRNADDDAKADNFISKFREQLKLQRVESLVRYNEMLSSPN